MKIITLAFFTFLLVACNNNMVNSKTQTIPFESRAFSVHDLSNNSSVLRMKLLHEIFMSKKELKLKEEEKISEHDLANIKDDKEFNLNFSKLIVSYADKEELYYIPEGSKKDNIIALLNLPENPDKSWVWKSDIKKGQTVYLVEVNAEEVLENEKKFSISITNSLKQIYPFQDIELSLDVESSMPKLVSEELSVRLKKCNQPENPEACFCQYSHLVPNGEFLNYAPISKDTVEGDLLLGDKPMSIVFKKENTTLKSIITLNQKVKFAVPFSINFPSFEQMLFTSKPNNCTPLTANQDFILKNYLKYHITYKIFGSNETLETFGKMPQEISQYIY